MKKLIASFIIIVTIALVSCTDEPTEIKISNLEKPNQYLPGSPANQYEWLGEMHNIICSHLSDIDPNKEIRENPAELMDSITSYVKFLYYSNNNIDFNDFLDSLNEINNYNISNNIPFGLEPSDSIPHQTFFANISASPTFQSLHITIDNIAKDDNIVFQTRLDSIDAIGTIIENANISSSEKFRLKMQKFLAFYSANFWEQYVNENYSMIYQNQHNPKSNEIAQTASQKEAMKSDIWSHDQDAFVSTVTSPMFWLTGFGGGYGISAGILAAAVDDAYTSWLRYGDIKAHHWYGT